MLSMLFNITLILFVDVCCYDIMIVTILYHSYHSCPNYGHSHLLLETMVTVSMIIWAEDFFCKWWWLLVLVKILQSPKYTFWRLLKLIKSEGFERIGRTLQSGLGWFSWFSYLFRAYALGYCFGGRSSFPWPKWLVWLLNCGAGICPMDPEPSRPTFSGGIRHQTW